MPNFSDVRATSKKIIWARSANSPLLFPGALERVVAELGRDEAEESAPSSRSAWRAERTGGWGYEVEALVWAPRASATAIRNAEVLSRTLIPVPAYLLAIVVVVVGILEQTEQGVARFKELWSWLGWFSWRVNRHVYPPVGAEPLGAVGERKIAARGRVGMIIAFISLYPLLASCWLPRATPTQYYY